MQSVREISELARADIKTLAGQIGTLKATFTLLADSSGLSASWVEKFYRRQKDNPRQDSLDRLMGAIREIGAPERRLIEAGAAVQNSAP